ncbi:HDIG domain-containing protein [Virgibacillus necropolis]|uniref:HD family phosphohydrolase n=1 Tax=Virgibacillus necropolis TaxID=163877 RepID=UPI00385077C7
MKLRNIMKSLVALKTKWISIVFPMLVLGILIFLMTINNVHTETYDIERFSNAKETIRSPITIENEQETKRKTRETLQAVNDRYNISKEINEEQINYIIEIFDAIAKVEEKKPMDVQASEKNDGAIILSSQEKVQLLQQILSSEIVDTIDNGVLLRLVEASPKEREKGEKIFIDAVQEVLNNGVRMENVQSATNEVKQALTYSKLDTDVRQALITISDFVVVENSFYDVEKTLNARKEAANNVDPVVIRAGEIIVREGQTITDELFEELKLVGLLNNDRNVYPVIGLALLILLIIGVITYEMHQLTKHNKLDNGKIASILLISFIVVSMMKVVSLYTTQVNQLFFVVPVATGVLLIKQLINERFAIVLAGLYAILGSILFNSQIPGSLNIEAGIYFFFSQLAGIIFLMNVKDRLAILKAGIGMSIVNILAVLIFLFLSFEKYTLSDLFLQTGLGFAAAILSVVFTIGLLPFFETGLGILSDSRLLALASPNHPLLRKILTESPGTYHHSVMVANLSETACEAIGANGLLARVGAYYHDIGKLKKPHLFIENQLTIKNPHDSMRPKHSAEIIINHPYDGAETLKKNKFPKEIIDIAKEHHGTTLLKFFYYKEKENNKSVNEKSFRYPGPKPQTKEAAIICICDSVEAAVRSLNEPTEKKIEEIVSAIMDDRLMDGQLDDSPLTLNELKVIHRTVCEALKGIFHSRIQYPTKEAK